MILHTPVLLEEVIHFLAIKPNGVYVDATVGCGGHAEAIANCLHKGVLICIDWDEQSLQIAMERIKSKKTIFVLDNYINIRKIVAKKIKKQLIDGILFDLGISLFQITSPERGFSFQYSGPLDMRMDRRKHITAYHIINNFCEEYLSDIFIKYGEERQSTAKHIAHKIVELRKKRPIKTTIELRDIIASNYPVKNTKIDPATRIFQALRIDINRELENISKGLFEAIQLLKSGGRLVVISFHSLEDRIVKNFFLKQKDIKILTPKPIRPTPEQILSNPCARSAKLRAIEKW